jgi:hypothetical protein
LHFSTSTFATDATSHSHVRVPIKHGPNHLNGFNAAPLIGPIARIAAPRDPPIHKAPTNLDARLSTANANTINTKVKVPKWLLLILRGRKITNHFTDECFHSTNLVMHHGWESQSPCDSGPNWDSVPKEDPG